MKSYIHFIRHGITQGVLNKWYYGSTDFPLLPQGEQALLQLKAQGVYPSFKDADYYTSGMLRTDQTLAVLFGDKDFKTLPLLRELDFGKWECKTFDQLRKEPEFDLWMADEDRSFRFPGGESGQDFAARIEEGIADLKEFHRKKEEAVGLSEEGAHSILVCHGGVIGSLMYMWFPEERESFWNWIPDAGRGFSVEMSSGEAVGYMEI